MGKLMEWLFGYSKKTWDLVAKTYAPPIRVTNQKIEDSKILEKALFGVTTCVWQCRETGEIYSQEVLGSDKDRYIELIEKVNQAGGALQYIKENGKTYAIAEWIPVNDDNNKGKSQDDTVSS